LLKFFLAYMASNDMDLALLASQLSKGIEVRALKPNDHETMIQNCFNGKEAAGWIMMTKRCALDAAENIGNAMMTAGHIKHVGDSQPFRAEEECFYRFDFKEKVLRGISPRRHEQVHELKSEEQKDLPPIVEVKEKKKPEKTLIRGLISVVSKKRLLDEKLKEAEYMRTKVAKYTDLDQKRTRVSFLKQLIEDERVVLDKQRYDLNEKRQRLLKLVDILSNHYDLQLTERKDTIDGQLRLDEQRAKLRLLERKMKLRRHKMVYTIGKRIFPLAPAKRNVNGMARIEDRKYTIGNNGSYLVPKDQMLTQMMRRTELDRHFGTGLGLVCLLVQLLGRYLGVYLPAKIRFRGSRSEIRDPSFARSGKRVYLPLYTDCTKEKKSDFILAIEKLHLNVSHLAHARNLETSGEFLRDLDRVMASLII